MTNNFPYLVAVRTLALLDERKARIYKDSTSFYIWQRADRVVVIFDTNTIDIGKINADFAHRLSTRLQGRLVVRTNSRGLFLQVGHVIPPALVDMTATPLDMTKQPTPFHLPVGVTVSGRDMWLNLLEADSILVGGSRGLGKTGFIHGAIQALLNGASVEVYAYDGKGGVEFARYMDHPKFHLAKKLSETLAELKVIAKERRKTLLASGQPNMLMHNRANPNTPAMMPIALIIDEAALTTEEEKAGLVDIVERERATGFYPILATNRPEQSALLVKSNLVTRISFPVPSWHASQMVLGQNGAETLPKIRGRGLIVHQARVTEFQSFEVDFPAPSEDTIKIMLGQEDEPTEPTPTNEIEVMAERIRAEWTTETSKTRTAKLLGFPQYGGSYQRKTDDVIAYLRSTTKTTTTTENRPEIGNFSPEMA